MERYVVAVDQSTSASKVFLIDGNGEIVRRFAREHKQAYPKPGYVEHDAEEIWRNVCLGIRTVCEGLAPGQAAALGISNQRETTVFWERATGRPVHPAVVWQDVRAEGLCAALGGSARTVLEKTGLRLSAYYPAAKAAFVLHENPDLRARVLRGEVCIGTMDAFLVFRLTEGRAFRTDVSNASRTELMGLRSLQWDDGLLALFGIPRRCLPEITPSDGDFGRTSCEGVPGDIPVTGVMGDSHAALFGQGCCERGMTKATYGTGSSVMMNVGETPPPVSARLSASVGYAFNGKTNYVLEGNVTCSGDTLRWLCGEAGLAGSVEELNALAASVGDAGGVYVVPAFSGFGAPYFEETARGAIMGLGRGDVRAHIARAALESLAYQDADVIDVMESESGLRLTELRADGAPAGNPLVMRFQADLLGRPVLCAAHSELSALGAAYMAGLRTGLYASPETIGAANEHGRWYTPTLPEAERLRLLEGWRDAVRRCISVKPSN
jgi:glycerol kinase